MRNLIPLSVRRALGGRWDRWQAGQARSKLLRRLSGNRVACNICRWEGSALTDDCWHRGTICPSCASQVRHRLLAAALDGLASLPGVTEGELLRGKDVLHFAPERQLSDRVRLAARRYVTADFGRGDCDILLDISHMTAVADTSFDTVIVCDVLEHVPDDASAFLELNRILRPGGTAVLTVPQADPPATTDEDPTVRTERDREIRFGQKDHVRMYGDDFPLRLQRVGFQVLTLTEADFPADIQTRHVLFPPKPNPSPLATNQRRIYFASKPV